MLHNKGDFLGNQAQVQTYGIPCRATAIQFRDNHMVVWLSHLPWNVTAEMAAASSGRWREKGTGRVGGDAFKMQIGREVE